MKNKIKPSESKLYSSHISEWVKFFKKHNIEHFQTDGPVTEAYWEQPIRIVIANLESYGYDECNHSKVQKEIHTWFDDRHNTVLNSILFAHCLLSGIKGELLSRNQMLSLRKQHYEIRETLDKTSYINLKKVSGSQVNLNKHEYKSVMDLPGYCALLKTQIEALNPHILIVSGRDGLATIRQVYANSQISYNGSLLVKGGPIVGSIRHFSRIQYANFEDRIDVISQLHINRK